ncbi:MAG: SH3 domain-containing protein, partial [Chloroflexota bacterium]
GVFLFLVILIAILLFIFPGTRNSLLSSFWVLTRNLPVQSIFTENDGENHPPNAIQPESNSEVLPDSDNALIQSECMVANSQGLNLRSGPSISYEPPIAQLPNQTELIPIAYQSQGTPNSEWIEVIVVDSTLQGTDADSSPRGWVNVQYVDCGDLPLHNLPTGSVESATQPIITQAPTSQVVVTQPSTLQPVVVLTPTPQLTVFQTSTPLPMTSQTSMPPVCEVRINSLNLRNGPSVAYEPPIMQLSHGAKLTPISYRNQGDSNGEWVEVIVTESSIIGWVSVQYVNCGDFPFRSLPAGLIQPPPHPTMTQFPTPMSNNNPSRNVSPPSAQVMHQPTPNQSAAIITSNKSCEMSVNSIFVNIWAKYKGRIGCPKITEPISGFWAEQPFQNGHMFWSDSASIYLVKIGSDSGWWRLIPDNRTLWNDTMPQQSCMEQPPANTYTPVRGFGAIRCSDKTIREQIGWGIDHERGFQNGINLYQSFDNGYIFRDSDGNTNGLAYILFSDGSFLRDQY